MELARMRILVVVGSLALAVGTGHVMQNGLPVIGGTRPQPKPSAIVPLSASFSDKSGAGLPQLPDVAAPLLKGDAALPGRIAGLESLGRSTPQLPDEPQEPFRAGCVSNLTLRPGAMATIAVDLEAPCAAGSRIEVGHAGLSFAAMVPQGGRYLTLLPALAADAEVTVRLPEDDSVSARIQVPTLKDYARSALEWQGDTAFHLHAYEQGAAYGAKGHAHVAVAGLPVTRAIGSVIRLGDPDAVPPLMAEVYSTPVGTGRVRLELASEVTEAACNTEVSARAIVSRGGIAARTAEITMAMPGCDALGEYVVMQLPGIETRAIATSD